MERLGPLLVVVGLCAAVGLVQGLLVVGLQVPAWAASLGVAIGLLIWIQRFSASVEPADGYDAGPHAYYWFGGLRRGQRAGRAGRPRSRRSVAAAGGSARSPIPADRRGLVAALVAVGATVASSVLAGLGGVLVVATVHQAQTSDELSPDRVRRSARRCSVVPARTAAGVASSAPSSRSRCSPWSVRTSGPPTASGAPSLWPPSRSRSASA